ncbi:hypothetical protein HPP92_020602 [Vanilla planifolia]|uniref:Uncharacterized protein n=1 Tax=Vanilla planifolia TaxID=51239 RepID=A0A835PX69_VANPL|nr:hypothetical protein HPP92_020602 [Vanilla planifolia]
MGDGGLGMKEETTEEDHDFIPPPRGQTEAQLGKARGGRGRHPSVEKKGVVFWRVGGVAVKAGSRCNLGEDEVELLKTLEGRRRGCLGAGGRREEVYGEVEDGGGSGSCCSGE